MKDADVRLREAVETIRSKGTVRMSATQRQWVAMRVEEWIRGNPQAAQATSAAMSQKGAPGRAATEQQRAEQRALVLLQRINLYDNAPLAWGDTTTLADAIAQAFDRFSKDDANYLGSLRTELLGNPGQFLKKHYIDVAGLDDSQEATYLLRYVLEGKGALRLFPSARDQTGNTRTHKEIRAINIPGRLLHDVENDIGHIPATDSGNFGAAVMLTSQFSGCTYCFQVNGGRMLAAHIDPGGGRAALGILPARDHLMAAKLRVQGAFHIDIGGSGFRAFGRLDHGANPNAFGYGKDVGNMVIVAVRQNAVWNIYAQMRDTMGQISAVRRLYPDPPIFL